MDVPPVGSLVVPAPGFRETMGTGEGAAILLALRRGSAHLYYPGTDASYWVPTRNIRRIPRDAVAEQSLERFLTDLLLFLEADECRIDDAGDDTMKLAIESPGLTRARLRELEGDLGERLDDFAFEPRNMHAVLIRLRLVSLPASADTGT